jgi:hypothetical protein
MLQWFDYVLIAVVAVLLGLAVWYIRRQKKGCSGCASCPYAGSCTRVGANRKRNRKQK